MKTILALILSTALALSGVAGCNYAMQNARNATEEIEAQVVIIPELGDFGALRWTGTGFYFSTQGAYSVVATAGHVCQGTEALELGLPKPTYMVGDLPGYVIYDHDNAPEDDICLLLVEAPAQVVLTPADDVDVGQRVFYVGYPNGTRGTYEGLVERVDSESGSLVSIPGYFGASGSAMLDNNGRVVGVVSMGDMEFTHHIYVTTLDAVKDAHEFALRFLRYLHAKPLEALRSVGLASE